MKKNGIGARLRGAVKLVAMGCVLVVAALDYLCIGARRRELAVKAEWLSRTCRRLLGVLGIRVVSRGVPARGSVIAANHLSYIDIVVLSSLTPVVFVAKREVRGWPLFGWFAEKAGTRFIDREKRGDVTRIGGELGPVMEAGASVVLFLEGTTSDGRDVLPFKASLLAPSVAAGWRLTPAGITYAVPDGRRAETEVCWWGDMTLPPHLGNLATLPWVEARVAWGESVQAVGDRKVLAAKLRDEVVGLRCAGVL